MSKKRKPAATPSGYFDLDRALANAIKLPRDKWTEAERAAMDARDSEARQGASVDAGLGSRRKTPVRYD